MMEKILWVCGQYKGEVFPNTNWDLYGIFDSEKKAVAACKDKSYFVGPVEMNKILGEKTIKWPGCYYPLSKEQSKET